jgi:hypothetical protein
VTNTVLIGLETGLRLSAYRTTVPCSADSRQRGNNGLLAGILPRRLRSDTKRRTMRRMHRRFGNDALGLETI